MYKVNDTVISHDDVYREMQYHPAESQEQAEVYAVEALIIRELLTQRAESLGFRLDEEETFVEKLLDAEVQYPRAGEGECLQYYENNQKKFSVPPLLEVKHILLACAPDDVEERSLANETAQSLIDQLNEGAREFSDLAKHHSECPSSKVGGSLGQISRGQTVPEFEKQLFNCDVGLVQQPMESRYGVHVVYVAHREEGHLLPYEKVADDVHDYLDKKVRRVAISQYIATLIDNATIEGFDFVQKERNFYH